MKTLIAALAALLIPPAFAQTVACGPYLPGWRAINPDGTETVYATVSCVNPDPATWDHTYTFSFPSTIYEAGLDLSFVGNAQVEVIGHHDCVSSGRAGHGCEVRLTSINSATLVDASGNSLPLIKKEIGTIIYPVDEWLSTTPLAADTIYGLAASGVSTTGIPELFHIQATYQVIPPTARPPCTGECGDTSRRD